MTTTTPDIDPLETYESVPAVSFHEPNGGYAQGKWAKLTVRDWPKLLEQKDDDGNVERWDNGDPKLVLVVPVTDEEGEDKNLWAKKFGKKAAKSIFQQLATAQKKVKEDIGDPSYRLGPGDVLAIKYIGDDRSVPPKKGNYPKMFEAVIRPGARPAPNADPFAEEQKAPASAEPSSDPWTDSAPASSAPTTPAGGDPFGPADSGDDEPPF